MKVSVKVEDLKPGDVYEYPHWSGKIVGTAKIKSIEVKEPYAPGMLRRFWFNLDHSTLSWITQEFYEGATVVVTNRHQARSLKGHANDQTKDGSRGNSPRKIPNQGAGGTSPKPKIKLKGKTVGTDKPEKRPTRLVGRNPESQPEPGKSANGRSSGSNEAVKPGKPKIKRKRT